MAQFDISTLAPPIALVVDDEPLILLDTADIIADEGFSVIEARSAEQAFDFLKSHSSLELLVTDVQMSGDMDGFELARQVAERWPNICIVVASGARQPKDGELPDTATFVAKPLSARTVHDVIKNHCAKIKPR